MSNDVGITSKLMKDWMNFIDRVGFPIAAFIMMSIMCFVFLMQMNKTIQANTEAIGKFSSAFTTFQTQVMIDHKEMMRELLIKRQ